MKNYDVEISGYAVQKVYDDLIEKITEHVKVLSLNGKPITTVMGVKRELVRMRKRSTWGYGMEHGAWSREQGDEDKGANGTSEKTKLNNEEVILAMEILECMGIDVHSAVVAGLTGEKEMKKSLIIFHYDRMAKTGRKYKDIKEELSKKYNMSAANIEKIVYRNPLCQRKADTSPEGRTGTQTNVTSNSKDDGKG
jgi:hypothetical protein